MDHLLWGLILAALAAVFVCIARLQRKREKKDYSLAALLYSAKTGMKIVDVEETSRETWENGDGGRTRRGRSKIYLPTYEYTVDGRTYRYKSRVSVSSKREVGRTVTGYYNPELITEEKPKQNICCFFVVRSGRVLSGLCRAAVYGESRITHKVPLKKRRLFPSIRKAAAPRRGAPGARSPMFRRRDRTHSQHNITYRQR